MNATTPASSAVQAALARIRACAATAALATLIVPLATTPAQAAIIVPPTSPYVTAQSFTAGGSNLIVYTVYNKNGTGTITQIELPEVHAGDINFNFTLQGTGGNLNSNYTQTESMTAQFSTSTIANGTAPGAYVDLTGKFIGAGGQAGIAPNGSQSFTALVPTTAITDANFTLHNGGDILLLNTIIDPPIPDTSGTAVPEPASLALLGAGLLAVTGLRRRKG